MKWDPERRPLPISWITRDPHFYVRSSVLISYGPYSSFIEFPAGFAGLSLYLNDQSKTTIPHLQHHTAASTSRQATNAFSPSSSKTNIKSNFGCYWHRKQVSPKQITRQQKLFWERRLSSSSSQTKQSHTGSRGRNTHTR